MDPKTIMKAVETAYEAFEAFKKSQEISLQEATDQILSAVSAAKTDIVAQIEAIAAADARACSRSAVIDFFDIAGFSPDNLQDFARDATECVARSEALIVAAEDHAAIDQIGFALNIVGPIALIARARAGLSSDLTRATLNSANELIIQKLDPSCRVIHLTGDAEPGGPVETQVRCRAFNGNTGHGFGSSPSEFDRARRQAMRDTSYMVALAALAVLKA